MTVTIDIGLLVFFLSGTVAALILIPITIGLCNRLGIVDQPGHRKIHKLPVPNLGGAAVLLSILIGLMAGLMLCQSDPFYRLDLNQIAKLSAILGTAFLFGLLGLVDDLFQLKPRIKLMGQTLISLVFAGLGFHFQCLHLPGFPVWDISILGIFLTMFWIMAVVNGFNFIDGLDGLAGSVAVVVFGGLVLLSVIHTNHVLEILGFPVIGALLVFLWFNWRPAKIYLGDTGSHALGALAACSLISLGQGSQPPWFFYPQLSFAKPVEPFRFEFLVATLVVGYPILEVTLSAFRRGLRRVLFGRSMEWSEQEHIHHRLIKLGFKPGAICVIAGLFNAALIASGFLAMAHQNALAVLCAAPVVIVLAAIMPRMGFFDFLDIKHIQLHQPHYQIAHHFIGMQSTKLRLAQNQDEIVTLVNQTCTEFGVLGYRIWCKSEVSQGAHFSWERSLEDMREYLNYMKDDLNTFQFEQFKDSIHLENGNGDAYWIFEPHSEDGVLDVEYRVLVHGFMREALARLLLVKPSETVKSSVVVGRIPSANVHSSLLRRRLFKK